jgi:tetratricopeptide (TPR) repeat protein
MRSCLPRAPRPGALLARGAPPLVWPLMALLGLLLVLPAPLQAEGPDNQPLLHQLKDGRVEVRRHALVGLADSGDFTAVPQVAAALRDIDPVTRKLAERALWSIWMRSGDEQVDDLLKVGTQLLGNGQAQQSVPIFTRVIELAPKFAEGYNKRATAYYHMGEFEKSLADIGETLRLNPYHFGALSGAGLCLIELERYEEAIGYFDRALKINPNLDGIQELRKAVQKRVHKPVV